MPIYIPPGQLFVLTLTGYLKINVTVNDEKLKNILEKKIVKYAQIDVLINASRTYDHLVVGVLIN